MLPEEMQESDLQLISEASRALNRYLDAVAKDETSEIRKRRWLILKEALSGIGKISPQLKEAFIKTHNLSRDKNFN